MARIALLSPDLLFGSKVEGALAVAGHKVNRFDTEQAVRPAASFHDLLIVDLTAEDIDGPALVRSMREQGELDAVPDARLLLARRPGDPQAGRGRRHQPRGAALAHGA